MSFPLTKLGDMCDLVNGYAFKSSDYLDASNTLSCRMSNIRPSGRFDIEYNARYLPDHFAEKYKQFTLKDGDVVIAMTDLADSPKILGVPTVIKTNGKNILLNQRVGKLVIKDSNRVYFPYLQLALNSPRVRSVYKRFAGGGLQINLGKADLLSVEIPLPPLAEQQKIVAILDAADSLRQKDRQLIDHYTTLSQSLFLEMFGDPVTNPMGWKKELFLDVFNTKTGKLDSNAASVAGIYPFFTCAKDELRIDSYSYDDEVLLLAGNNAAGVFDVKYYKGKFDAYQRTYILIIQGDKLTYPFMQISLEKKLIDLQRLSIGSSTQYLTMKILGRLEFIVPPITLQNQFAERIKLIEAQKQQAQVSLEKSEALFNSLLQRAFSGELTGHLAA